MNPSDVLYSYDRNKRGPRKDYAFYKSVVSLYESDSEKAKEIIQALPKIGYYKDFFYILEVSSNETLNDYIYDHIINLMKQWSEGKNLILAKWLPREKSSFDKKFHCVDKIAKKLFPNEKINSQRYNYRKLVSLTAKKLNILETNLCAKTYDNITDLTENNLKTYEKLFLKNPLLQQRLIEILDQKYKTYSIQQLVDEYEIKTVHKIRKPLLDKYIEIKKSENFYPEDYLLILDISGDLFNNKVTSLYTRILIYAINHTELIINGKLPRLLTFEKNLSMDGVKQLVDSNLGSPDRLNMRKIQMLTENKYKSYTIISSSCQDFNTNGKILSWDVIDSSYSKKRVDLQILKEILNPKISIQSKKKSINWNLVLMFILMIMLLC